MGPQPAGCHKCSIRNWTPLQGKCGYLKANSEKLASARLPHLTAPFNSYWIICKCMRCIRLARNRREDEIESYRSFVYSPHESFSSFLSDFGCRDQFDLSWHAPHSWAFESNISSSNNNNSEMKKTEACLHANRITYYMHKIRPWLEGRSWTNQPTATTFDAKCSAYMNKYTGLHMVNHMCIWRCCQK